MTPRGNWETRSRGSLRATIARFADPSPGSSRTDGCELQVAGYQLRRSTYKVPRTPPFVGLHYDFAWKSTLTIAARHVTDDTPESGETT
jgi:hypothetical protein